MYGFQPKSARGKTVQQLADGGMVHSIKGMLGLRPKTREELLAADAKAQARNQEAAAKMAERAVQQPAPAASAPQSAITDYTGMSAMQRREKEQGLKNGGMVKPHGFKAGGMILGPGTGTSDSIETEKRPGTFIMPADSTKAIGPEALEELGESEEMGEEAVPVRLSNGEFEFTPEEVQALGEAVLTVMRDATHKAVGEGGGKMRAAAGFAPVQAFSGGGTVQDEEKNRLANQTAMYVQGAQAAAASRPPEPVAQPVAPAPAPAAKDPLDGGAAFGVFPQLAGGKRTTYAMDDKLRTGVQATGPSTFAQATPTEKTIIGGGDGRRMNAEQDPRSLTATGMGAVAGVPGTTPSITPQTDVQRGGGNVPAVAPPSTNPAAPSPAATGAEIAPGVYRHGRGQYSDNAAGMGMPANFTGQPTAQNLAAADNLARGFVPGGNASPAVGGGSASAPVGKTVEQAQREGLIGERVGYNPAYDQRLNGATGISAQNMAAADALVARNTPAGFQPAGSLQASVQAPIVRNSTNDWAARNNLRNMEVSAKSITANGGRFDQSGRGDSPEVAAYKAALTNDHALQQAQPGMDQTAMRENAAITREGMQQAGATTRTGMQEQGANTREAGRNTLATEELGLKREAQGFQTRAAQQQEQLRNVIVDPKATPAQKRQAQESLRSLGVKVDDNRFTVVPGGQEWDATAGAMRNVPARVLNNQTGRFVEQAQGGAGGTQPLPNHVAALRANPAQAAQFDAQYGPGAAARALGR